MPSIPCIDVRVDLLHMVDKVAQVTSLHKLDRIAGLAYGALSKHRIRRLFEFVRLFSHEVQLLDDALPPEK